jgi:hypothetical protein
MPERPHLERARDRSGRQRQAVDRGLELLQLLLGGHPEALLLVHDQQAEVAEDDVLREDAVGADQHVDAARGGARSARP